MEEFLQAWKFVVSSTVGDATRIADSRLVYHIGSYLRSGKKSLRRPLSTCTLGRSKHDLGALFVAFVVIDTTHFGATNNHRRSSGWGSAKVVIRIAGERTVTPACANELATQSYRQQVDREDVSQLETDPTLRQVCQ